MISYSNSGKAGNMTEQKNNMTDTEYPVWKRLPANQGRAPDNTANCSIEQQSITDYLIARLAFCKATRNVLNTELCSAEGSYTDSLIDSLYCEDTTLSKLLRRFPVSGQEDATPYVQELLTEYSDLLWASDHLKFYGWTRQDVMHAVSHALAPKELRECALSITAEPKVKPTTEAPDFGMSM